MKTRQTYGDGTVYQETPDKWTAKISLGHTPDGKPLTKRFSAKTKAEAERKLRDYKKSLTRAEKPSTVHYTVAAYFDFWLKTYQYQKLKPLSFDRLESTVRNHILPGLGQKKFDQVTQEDVQRLINFLHRQRGLSYSSVKKVYNALDACYRHAVIAGILTRNPCLGVVLPAASEGTKQVLSLSAAEVDVLKKELSRTDENGKPLYHYAHAYLLILNTGLRMGEALSLQWQDVDFTANTLTVNKTSILARNRDETGNLAGGYRLETQHSTKTASGHRTIPLNQSARHALAALRVGNDSTHVITNARGGAALAANFERSFQLMLSNAGLPRYGIHSLRHTFASLLFAAGVDIKVISKLLGHASVKITYDTYVHLFQEDYRGATEVLDSRMDTSF